MLRLTNVPTSLDYTAAQLPALAARRLRVPADSVLEIKLIRRSVDARDKGDVHFVLTLDVRVKNENEVLRRLKPGVAERVAPLKPLNLPKPAFSHPPLVVGAGPAGLFAALTLARAGARPILIERGKPVEERARDVLRLQTSSILDCESNVQFGEGGAGAFSDGKLTTGIKSPLIMEVLQTFVRHGAPEEILIQQKPHVGTDYLRRVVASIRGEIIVLGGEVRFSTKLLGLNLRAGHVVGASVRTPMGEEEIPCEAVLLCIGHSARDTVQALFRQGVRMAQKPFAMGVRVEHPQALINRAQYGRFADHPALKAADYKLSARTPDGRGCYTFCMCPGGEVICAASQEGGLAVNGMSYHARDGQNANAALLVGIRPEDFGDDHPLSGMVMQRALEQAAFRAGGSDWRAPVQRVEDFLQGRATTRLGDVVPSYRPGVTPVDLSAFLPGFITEDLRLGLRAMDAQLKGFAHPDAVLTGVETRSSSPVRILRDETRMAEGIDGLYPVGEGAGYAGGIVSAAVDGITAALSAMERSAAL